MADCPKCPPVGAPMWLATFADMMSLLMCFFVLLLSMASTEVVKFKAVADSMKDAFGVQREVQVDQVPMGTSIIAQNFSPGQVTPSPLDEVKQSTAQDSDKISETPEDLEKAKQKLIEAKLKEIKEQAENIKKQLATEIEQGLVTVETNGSRIIVRINEKGSFSSASAVLKPGFEPVMDKITDSVSKSEGKVIVAGHTDDIPIKTATYRSNWELSSSRAVTVAQYMFEKMHLDPQRFLIEGHAETHPLVPNTSPQNRAINRRVEIVIARDDVLLNTDSTNTQIIQTDTTPDKKP